jgi:hypothetical protein
MAEEKKENQSMADWLEEQQKAANEKVIAAESQWNTLKDKYNSAYQGMLANLKPEVDTKKEENLKKMGKTQAWTDFLTALTNGIIGGASKGYAPQIGANAQPYAVNLENLREINKQKQENYAKMKAQADLALLENDLKDAQTKYQGAVKGAADANDRAYKWVEKIADQNFKAGENAKDRAARAEEKNDKKDTLTFPIGSAEVTVPKTFKWETLYSTLTEQGVPKIKKMVTGTYGMSEWIDVDEPNETQFKHWVARNADKVLPYLAQFKDVTISNYTPIEQPTSEQPPKPVSKNPLQITQMVLGGAPKNNTFSQQAYNDIFK